MKESQHSIAVRPKLIKQLRFTALKILKSLEGEEFARCVHMFRRNVWLSDCTMQQCVPEHKMHVQFGMYI